MEFNSSINTKCIILCRVLLYGHAPLSDGVRSEKYITRQIHCCANTECAYTSLGGLASYTPRQAMWHRLLLLGYKPIQHVTVKTTHIYTHPCTFKQLDKLEPRMQVGTVRKHERRNRQQQICKEEELRLLSRKKRKGPFKRP